MSFLIASVADIWSGVSSKGSSPPIHAASTRPVHIGILGLAALGVQLDQIEGNLFDLRLRLLLQGLPLR